MNDWFSPADLSALSSSVLVTTSSTAAPARDVVLGPLVHWLSYLGHCDELSETGDGVLIQLLVQ